jgi:CheY-like chemotaxis protein
MNQTASCDILLVEDNPQDLELALRAFAKSEIKRSIHVARDGLEAVDYLFCEGEFVTRSIKDTPQLILLDLKLPKISGLEVIERIKIDPRTCSIPLVVLTSSKERRDLVDSYRMGINSYIVKPVSFEQFAEVVQQLAIYWMRLNQPPNP